MELPLDMVSISASSCQTIWSAGNPDSSLNHSAMQYNAMQCAQCAMQYNAMSVVRMCKTNYS